MKALRAEAEWAPRNGCVPKGRELTERRASSGSRMYRKPVLDIFEVKEPEPGPDELLVKVKYCGICGSDTHVYESDDEGYVIFSGPAKFPCTLGHEYSGEVVAVGREVTGFRKGDIITGESVLWCGTCMPCRYGMLNQCENVELLGLTHDGAFAEYIAVKAKYCWNLNRLHDRFTDEEVLKIGTLVEPIGCAYNGIFISGGGFSPGAYAVVYGAGPIGLGAVLLLKAAGAAKIIAVDVVDERLGLAKRMGADHVLNAAGTEDLEEIIMDLTSGWGADLQVEAAGAARQTVPMMEKLYSRRAKIIYLGRAEALATVELNRIVSGAHSIIGSRGHSGYGIFPNIIRLLQEDRLNGVGEMITSVFPFSGIADAFTTSTKRVDGKILIDIG
ncbi:MAG: alcohol dehydrogenase catalytic domain-containing protein [Alphaproteobacteria bacterium]|uniref:Alcohol dehydrogenase catalytic domain-containing protein n=1 Tax=Candidatus Nitrobium versatile TaxID=2884831 RepID=A0A953J8G9_9BACT|nr:alcohol dehydrogenase catalytic domain-containing protein [Candidatus Nitrobium versatile]